MIRNVSNAPHADVDVQPSLIHGMGLFARRAFEPGEIVLRWDLAQLIPKNDFSFLSPTEQHYTHPFDEERLVVVQPPERFVNHSCDNNTEVRNFCDVAIRRISPGERSPAATRQADPNLNLFVRVALEIAEERQTESGV